MEKKREEKASKYNIWVLKGAAEKGNHYQLYGFLCILRCTVEHARKINHRKCEEYKMWRIYKLNEAFYYILKTHQNQLKSETGFT